MDQNTSKEQHHTAIEPRPLRRRDLLQGAAIGAAAVASGSLATTCAEAAEPVSKDATAFDQFCADQLKTIPSDYDPTYVKNAIIPFLRSNSYEGERAALPMIDINLSKEMAFSPNSMGMLYDSWQPEPEAVGVSVFIQALEKRGPDNLRKKIYVSAMTPDLYRPMYSGKIKAFFDTLFDDKSAGQPLMARYNDGFFDVYWNLHLGAKGDEVPQAVREFGASFNAVLAYRDPRQRIVYDNYMRARALRKEFNEWVDARLKDIASGKLANSEKTFAYWWIKNGAGSEHFREKDIAFECFHNMLAMAQWGVVLYRFMEKLSEDRGDQVIRAVFKKTMESDPDNAANSAFSPLDRFVMELFRTIPINPGSNSTIKSLRKPPETTLIRTPHVATCLDPRHWDKPNEFNPDRYLSVPTSDTVDRSRALEMGFATPPFESAPFQVKDGRKAELTNSAFGAVYGVVDGKPLPLCDYAGFAPFGFGYRRCAGEQFIIDVFKDFFRKAWSEKMVFRKLKGAEPKQVVVGISILPDDIVFSQRA